MVKQILGIVLCLVCYSKTEDEFWKNVEIDLFKKVDLTIEKNRIMYANELMSTVKYLAIRLQKEPNSHVQKNLQEAIEIYLGIYIYIMTLDKYIKVQPINELLFELEAAMYHNRGSKEKLSILNAESSKVSDKINSVYSKSALIDLIKTTLMPYPFIYNKLNDSMISNMAQDLLSFVSYEMIEAKKSFRKPLENNDLLRFIQLAPLISKEYAFRNGRFYLKALVEELTILKKFLTAGKESYKHISNELLKNLVDITSKDLITISALA